MRELLFGVGVVVLAVADLLAAFLSLRNGGWFVTPFGLLWVVAQIGLALLGLVFAYCLIDFGWDRLQRERRRRR